MQHGRQFIDEGNHTDEAPTVRRVTARRSFASANTTALWILVVLAAMFFMRAARALLIPIALAVLISYALEPIVAWLERHRVPRIAGAAFILVIILGLL